MRAVVLAAGRGSRLGHLVAEVPKPLLPVGGVPLLGRTLSWLGLQGFREILVNTHTHGGQFAPVIGDGTAFGVRVTWWPEPELRGTAGTLRALPESWRAEHLLVVYGDLLCDMDLGPLLAAHTTCRADATLVVHRRRGGNSAVTLGGDGRILRFIERPSPDSGGDHEGWTNSGIQVVGPQVVAAIPENIPADLAAEVYAPLATAMRLFAVPLTGSRVAIDSPERYALAEALITEGRWCPRRREPEILPSDLEIP